MAFTNKSPQQLRAEKIPLNTNWLREHQDVKIVLVEGTSDIFYSSFINPIPNRIIRPILGKDKEPELLSIIRKEFKNYTEVSQINLNCVFIKFLILLQLKEVENKPLRPMGKWYGIIDRDFISKDKILTAEYKNQLICTDKNDLETTLLYYNYDYWNNYFSSVTGIKNTLDIAVEFSSFIGHIRYKHKNGILKRYINFDNVENKISEDKYGQLNGYLLFIQIDDSGNFQFNFPAYLTKLLSDSSLNERKQLESISSDKINLDYCRGHDIFNLLSCFYYRLGLFEDKITKYRGTLEKIIESEASTKEKFKESEIFKFIESNILQ